MIKGVMAHSICVSEIPNVSYSQDPDDNKIMATAIAGQADYIVTGDKQDLLILQQAEGIVIITAKQAVDLL